MKQERNTYDLTTYDYGVGYTAKCEKFYFDLEDYNIICEHCWHTFVNKRGHVYLKDRNGILMHRLVMGLEKHDPRFVDHISHKTLDNRKANLRIADNQTNQMNKSMQNNNTSGAVGVSLNKKSNKWEAYIRINKKRIYLGLFENFDDAVKARKEAEIKYFGEWSYDASIKQSEQYEIETN